VVTPLVTAAGLNEYFLGGSFNEAALPATATNTGVAGPRMGNVSATGGNANGSDLGTKWADNTTVAYAGKVSVPNNNGNGTGTIAFGESFDDNVLIKVDGQQVLRDTTWNGTSSTGALTLSAGLHDIEIRFGQGGGGAGPVQDDTNKWGPGTGNNGLGFGAYIPASSPTDPGLVGTNYVDPSTLANAFFTSSGGGTVQVLPGAELRARTVTGATTTNLAGRLTLTAGTSGAPLASDTGTLAVSGLATADVGAFHTLTAGSFAPSAGASFTKAGAGTLTVTGGLPVPVNQNTLRVRAGVMNLGTATLAYTPTTVQTGLREYYLAGAFNEGALPATPNNTGITSTRMAQSTTTGGTGVADLGTKWTDNSTVAYAGFIYVPDNGTVGDGKGTISFAESFDDSVLVKIDGQQVLRDTGWNVTTGSGALTLDSGYHTFEARFGQGGGGAGPSSQNGWPGTLGFGVHLSDGLDGGTDPTKYVAPDNTVDVGDGSGNALFVSGLASAVIIDSGGQLVIGGVSDATIPITLGTANTATGTGTLSFAARATLTNHTLSNVKVSAASSGTLDVGANNVVSLVTATVPSGSTLNKSGAGTLTLTGAHPNVVGSVIAQQGTVNGGGSIAGPLRANANAVVAPGVGVGRLTTGGLTLDPLAVLQVEMSGTAAATGYDQVAVNGSVSLAGSVLQISLLSGFAPTTGTFTIIDNDGTDAVVGQFAQSTYTVGGTVFSVNYAGGTGNDVVLTAAPVPEPTAVGLLGVGALGLLARRTRRRCRR
ncbi:MAG TPA: PEP-CTERM sorting domain-containing protein, partial [Humisphaera sp.]